MNIAIEWERCPDGLASTSDPQPDTLQAALGELMGFDPKALVEANLPESENKFWLRYKSKRRESYVRRLEGLQNPLVLDFANTRHDTIEDFVTAHGFPVKVASWVAVEELFAWRLAFRKLFEYCEQGDIAAAADWLGVLRSAPNDARRSGRDPGTYSIYPDLIVSEDGSASLTLIPETLQGFMLLEASAIIASGAKVMRCQHCGNFFVAGEHTGRRTTAHYCSNRCRVAAQRARA